MCYETYERLLSARTLRRAAQRPGNPDHEAPAQDARKPAAQPMTEDEGQVREKAPA